MTDSEIPEEDEDDGWEFPEIPEDDWDFGHTQFIFYIWLCFTTIITYRQKGGGLLLSIAGLILAVRFHIKNKSNRKR